jgi:hypothetical protein
MCALEAVKNSKMSTHTANKILYQSLRLETKTMFEGIKKRGEESSLARQLKVIEGKLVRKKKREACVEIIDHMSNGA